MINYNLFDELIFKPATEAIIDIAALIEKKFNQE
jgi:hypothetical protein